MLQTKAIYNLLRLKKGEGKEISADSWALEDLRIVSLENLFLRLLSFGVHLDKEGFFHFAEECDTPEELFDLLYPETLEEKQRDALYLLVFELWRRLLPEKPSLSIFCDELDHRLTLYEEGLLESDELIQDGLANLLEILEENLDAGIEAKEVFRCISSYFAHDLEDFLFEYISELLDAELSIYAAELIEAFFPFIQEEKNFAFLKARLLSFSDIHMANEAIEALLKEDVDSFLLFEMIQFLSAAGEHELFKKAVKKALKKIETQEELFEILRWTCDYFRRLDEEKSEGIVLRLLEKSHLEKADLQLFESLL